MVGLLHVDKVGRNGANEEDIRAGSELLNVDKVGRNGANEEDIRASSELLNVDKVGRNGTNEEDIRAGSLLAMPLRNGNERFASVSACPVSLYQRRRSFLILATIKKLFSNY